MPIAYDNCDNKTDVFIRSILDKYHPTLSHAGVTIAVLIASDVDKNGDFGPAVKVHGHIAAAKIQITSLQDRVRGIADVKLTVDAFSWKSMAERSSTARWSTGRKNMGNPAFSLW